MQSGDKVNKQYGCPYCDVYVSLTFENGQYRPVDLSHPYDNGVGADKFGYGEEPDEWNLMIPASLGRLREVTY